MENNGFGIKPAIEQKPFENQAVQSFFTKWCEINDSIKPQIVSRDDWEKRESKGILERSLDGKQILYIPRDLQLWEMLGVIETVDHDTFATKPERRDKAKEKILELGKTFQNAAIYIAQRLDSIPNGKEIAKALAEEFYDYGQSLTSGEKLEKTQTVEEISSQTLTFEDLEAVDRFLAGDELYKSRKARAEKTSTTDPQKKEESSELERQKTLAQFFRVSENAFKLSGKTKTENLKINDADFKPWQKYTPIHNAFIAKIERVMKQKIETPKRELASSIFRRGMEFLQKNMPFDKLPDEIKNSILHWQDGESTLREALQIDKMKIELETIRKLGDVANISVKEREITDKIQQAVGKFPYELNSNNPSEMLANQYINCVGTSVLGGALMEEVGLNYLVTSLPRHSILFLITSDGGVEWRDMLESSFNERLTNEVIEGRKKDNSPLTTADIVSFSAEPKPEGLTFSIKNGNYIEKTPWGKKEFITLFEPEYGQKIQVLVNMGGTLFELGLKEEAIEAYREAIAMGIKDFAPYYNIAKVFLELGLKEEAIEAYREVIAMEPKYAGAYDKLGNALASSGRKKEAIEAYNQAVIIDPNHESARENIRRITDPDNKILLEGYQKMFETQRTKKSNWTEWFKKVIAVLQKK